MPTFQDGPLLVQIIVLITSFVALALILLRFPMRSRAKTITLPPSKPGLVLLFDKGALIDANTDAFKILGRSELREVNWRQIHGVFSHHIRTLPKTLGQINKPVALYPKNAQTGDVQALLEQWGTKSRLTVFNWPTQVNRESKVPVPVSEFEALTNASMDSPFPIWRRSMTGNINWANPAFFRECGYHGDRSGDGHRLAFDIPKDLKSGDSFASSFFSNKTNREEHFVTTMISSGKAQLFFATKANDVVDEQQKRLSYIQTLSQTFAQLSVGLAIFDSEKRLVLFNPALGDTFSLAADFLVARPTLKQFLDRLRDNRMIPEPKDYGTWREKLMHIVVDATDDCFDELWPLPSGDTIRATARPHKDGAIAFLFENISAEMTLERRFKADIEMMSEVIDSRDDAMAVLDIGGQFAFTNTAFRTMWGIEPELSLTSFTWLDFKPLWIDRTQDSQVFQAAKNYIALREQRRPFDRFAVLKDGTILSIKAKRLATGHSVFTFDLLHQTDLQKVMETSA